MPMYFQPLILLAPLFGLFAWPGSLLAADLVNGLPVEVLARNTVEEGGRKITFVRIRPPARPPRPTAPIVAPTATAALAEAEPEAPEARPYINWFPSVTVHTRPPLVSELRFRVGEREVTVWANIDFRLLRSLHQWETESAVYSWLPGLGDVSDEDDVRPADLGLAPGPAEYVVEASPAEIAAHEADFAALDAILAYHDLHHDALVVEQARRAALEAAQAAELARLAKLPPPKPKDETIYFWKNENPTPAP